MYMFYCSNESQIDAWLGLEYLPENWSWSDAGLYNYSNWNHGEPEKGEHCVRIKPNGRWYGIKCDINHESATICERSQGRQENQFV